jgi:hypothetical protein
MGMREVSIEGLGLNVEELENEFLAYLVRLRRDGEPMPEYLEVTPEQYVRLKRESQYVAMDLAERYVSFYGVPLKVV